MSPGTDEWSRRDVLKAAVAVGGAGALSACLDLTDEPVPEGVSDPSTLPARQHAWDDLLTRDGAENVELPRHQTLLYLTLDREGTPTSDDRRAVEEALSTLDRAYERSNRGLIYSLAYSPAYFSRFVDPLPENVDLPEPRRLSPFETPEFDRQDALLHLASDRADALIEAEEALTGERDTANEVTIETPLSAAFSVDSRRTGFIGKGMPAEKQDVAGIPDDDPVPEESPLFMGFKAGFAKNQASEEYVTIPDGPFAGATTKHVSKLRQRLDDWYVEQEFDDRVAEMFSPAHAERGLVEGIGDNLGDDSGVTPEIIESVREHAQQYGRVGHAQKAARANRDDEGNVRLLRRHFESTDENEASLHFPSLQRRITDFEEVREAMNGTDLTDEPAIRQRVNNGILEYIFVKNRGNFLVPPRRLRVLPTPTGEVPGL
ncbi:DUF7405 family protein [Haloprofundus salilacus]|uniref:DUF7405 family protein n=1 Tax=Haloprofundus salilacus TaxID=2876190 RepID=UPI001CCF4281|nr:twin-arginine translocation signal domain-containing protein [Haloprofundus salilacus]